MSRANFLSGVDGLDITADDIVILGSKDVNVAGLVDQVQGLARVDLIRIWLTSAATLPSVPFATRILSGSMPISGAALK